MVFMYVILSTAVLLIASVMVAVYNQKKIKVSVIAREEVNDKDFFALRVESEDFLFMRDEMQDVSFIQGLDGVEDFSIKNLAKTLEEETSDEKTPRPSQNHKVISLKGAAHEDKLVMPKSEKKAS